MGWGDIWVVNTDGSGLRQLTATTDASEEQSAWSLDGSKIAYGSGYPTKNESYTLQVMNADGSGSGPLTGEVVNGTDPERSPRRQPNRVHCLPSSLRRGRSGHERRQQRSTEGYLPSSG